MRDGEQQHCADRKRHAHPQQPGTGFAPFGVGVLDNHAHDHIGYAVKYAAEQHDKADGSRRNAGIVRIEQGEDRAHHAEYQVACGIAAAVGKSYAPAQLSAGFRWGFQGGLIHVFHPFFQSFSFSPIFHPLHLRRAHTSATEKYPYFAFSIYLIYLLILFFNFQ